MNPAQWYLTEKGRNEPLVARHYGRSLFFSLSPSPSFKWVMDDGWVSGWQLAKRELSFFLCLLAWWVDILNPNHHWYGARRTLLKTTLAENYCLSDNWNIQTSICFFWGIFFRWFCQTVWNWTISCVHNFTDSIIETQTNRPFIVDRLDGRERVKERTAGIEGKSLYFILGERKSEGGLSL